MEVRSNLSTQAEALRFQQESGSGEKIASTRLGPPYSVRPLNVSRSVWLSSRRPNLVLSSSRVNSCNGSESIRTPSTSNRTSSIPEPNGCRNDFDATGAKEGPSTKVQKQVMMDASVCTSCGPERMRTSATKRSMGLHSTELGRCLEYLSDKQENLCSVKQQIFREQNFVGARGTAKCSCMSRFAFVQPVSSWLHQIGLKSRLHVCAGFLSISQRRDKPCMRRSSSGEKPWASVNLCPA